MRYQLDMLDRMLLYTVGSAMEMTPTYRFFLDEPVDLDRMDKAIACAFEIYPMMHCQLVFDQEEKQFYLEDNPRTFHVLCCRFEDRPLNFGYGYGGHLFQVCCYANEVCFDWAHICTDGLGFLQFAEAVLGAYLGVELPRPAQNYTYLPIDTLCRNNTAVALGRPQGPGFDEDRIPHTNIVGAANCTTLSAPLEQILACGKRSDSTPAAVVSALVTITFREHIKKVDDNKDCPVRSKILASLRKPLNISTMHNCYRNLLVTYTDAFDKFDFFTICTIFRAIMDLQLDESSILHDIRIRREALDIIENAPDIWAAIEWEREASVEKKKNICNTNLSYLGKINFAEGIMAHLVDVHTHAYNDNCPFSMIAHSLGGEFHLDISDSYPDRTLVDELIVVAERYGITFQKVGDFFYKEAHYELPSH